MEFVKALAGHGGVKYEDLYLFLRYEISNHVITFILAFKNPPMGQDLIDPTCMIGEGLH